MRISNAWLQPRIWERDEGVALQETTGKEFKLDEGNGRGENAWVREEEWRGYGGERGRVEGGLFARSYIRQGQREN